MKRRLRAFTSIELVLVVAVVANLVLIVLPSLSRATRRSDSVRCLNNLKIIGVAAATYAEEHDQAFHFVRDGTDRAFAPNGGKWTRNPNDSKELAASHAEAYWGIAYRPYANRTKALWRCPSAKTVDEWRETGVRYPSDFWLNSSYGLNQYAVAGFGAPTSTGPRRLSEFESPGTTVFAQDAAEQRMEVTDDSLGLFPGRTECLTQWKSGVAGLYPGKKMEFEWFRHPTCNTVWVDGHVSQIGYTKKGIDYRFYTGEKMGGQSGF